MERRRLIVLVDRSGSMATIQKDMQGGIAAFLDEQRGLPGETRVSLYQFDTEFETVYQGKLLTEAPDYVLMPRASTALFDAVGKTVSAEAQRMLTVSEKEWPAKTVFLIVTDGEENASKELDKDAVAKSLRARQEEDGWLVIYLGANQDAWQAARWLGVSGRKSTMDYQVGWNLPETFRGVGVSVNSYYSDANATMDSFAIPEDVRQGVKKDEEK